MKIYNPHILVGIPHAALIIFFFAANRIEKFFHFNIFSTGIVILRFLVRWLKKRDIADIKVIRIKCF